MLPTPITLILDDSGPVNTMCVHDPQPWRVQNVPVSFLERFIEGTRRTGIRGKFSVIPMPVCVGRIDREIPGYPPGELAKFMELVRSEVAPRWDITPEILTHWDTLDLKTGAFLPIREDHWAATQTAETLADYLTLALHMLKSVGLEPNGITSPYMFGQEVEEEYARAVGMSVKRVCRLPLAWFFLHLDAKGHQVVPRDKGTVDGTDVVMIPACCEDDLWEAQNHRDPADAVAAVMPKVDALLSPDGKTGRIVELADAGLPVVLVTHWQSLFCEGHAAGLGALLLLADRINDRFGDQAQWLTPSELAARAVAARVSPRV